MPSSPQPPCRRAQITIAACFVIFSVLTLDSIYQAKAEGPSDGPGRFHKIVEAASPLASQLSAAVKLTNNSARDFHPAWSPDGATIVFGSDRIAGSGLIDIYGIRPDGTNERLLAQVTAGGDGRFFGPSWLGTSQDLLTVDRNIFWEVLRVRLSDAANSNSIPISRGVRDGDSSFVTRLMFVPGGQGASSPVTSPDGSKMAWAALIDSHTRPDDQQRYEVRVFGGALNSFIGNTDAAGSSVFRTDPGGQIGEGSGDVAFSPDGSKVCIAACPSGWLAGKRRDLFVVNLTNGARQRLTTSGEQGRDNLYVTWSSQNQIAFSSRPSDSGNYDLYTISPDGSGLTRLTDTPANEITPSWNPAGTRFAFASDASGNYELYVMDLGGVSPTPTPSPTPACPVRPAISTQPRSQTVESGQSASLTVEVSETNPVNLAFFRYQWFQGASGDTSHPVTDTSGGKTFTTTALTADTSYWVRVTFNGACPADSSTAFITVNPPKKRPLIFIPGILGSQLKRSTDGSEVWPGLLRTHGGLSLDPADASRYRDVFASGVIGHVLSTPVYGPLFNRLAEKGYQLNVNLYAFAYDWRLSNADNAEELKKLIERVRANGEVDLLAHSMGGILAERYILKNDGSHHVAKLITVGTPWLGAPKVINTLETGEFFEGWSRLIMLRGTLKKLVEFYPGAHELIPSPRYFDLGGHPFREAGWDVNGDGNESQDYTYKQMYDLLNQRHPRSIPAAVGLTFHSLAGQDGWSDGDDGTGVQYYHFYGLKSGADTIGTVVAKRISVCTRARICIPREIFDVLPAPGDGTVPVISARRTGGGLTLNSKRAVLRLFPYTSYPDDKVEHTGLTQNVSVQDAIFAALNELPGPPASAPSANGPAAFAPEEPPVQARYYLRLMGAEAVTVTDSHGNRMNPLGGEAEAGIDGVTAYALGDKALLLILPQTDTFDVNLSVGGETIAVDLRGGTDSETSKAVRYSDLNLPAGVKANLRISPDGAGNLLFDGDGDGAYETPVSPTVNLSGAAARDVEPPAVLFAENQHQSTTLLTISAADEGAGVKEVQYSLDGVHYQPYSGPISLDPLTGPAVYAFADDKAANRSPLSVYYPSPTANKTDNAQFFVRQHYLDFLNREPDDSGLRFWTGEITPCGADTGCREVKGVNVSAAFFLSIEFQETGYLTYRAHKAAYGNIPGKPVPITREQILGDMRQLGTGVIVGQGEWRQQLEQNKRTYFDALVAGERFASLYPQSLTPEQYVDALNANAGGALSQAERDGLVNGLKGGILAKAEVLRAVAEDQDLDRAEFNKAFVLMQYFGYLRRNPDDSPDWDFSGWGFWLDKLDQFNGNFVAAEMVKAFTSSIEYRQRFGP